MVVPDDVGGSENEVGLGRHALGLQWTEEAGRCLYPASPLCVLDSVLDVSDLFCEQHTPGKAVSLFVPLHRTGIQIVTQRDDNLND